MFKVAIANDHAGLLLKDALLDVLSTLECTVTDLGTNSGDSVDYPDYGNKMAEAITRKACDFGVLICGSGVGINIAANRHLGVRSAVCPDTTTAKLARLHNNANVIAFGARLIGPETAKDCLKTFLTTSFEGGRHEKRIAKLG